MKAVAFDYRVAADVADAVSLLEELGPDAKILAGGQSLGPMLNFRVVRPQCIIDISKIECLQKICGLPDGWKIGAAVTHSTIEDRSNLLGLGDALSKVARGIAYRAVRNRGTLGGSLAHADPSADWPVVMSALNARVDVKSVKSQRTIPAREFFVDQMETVLKPSELLTSVFVPSLFDGTYIGYSKTARKTGEFAESIVCAVVTFATDKIIKCADIWLGATNYVPQRLAFVEDFLKEREWSDEAKHEVKLRAMEVLNDDGTDYGRYKSNLHSVNVSRAIENAFREATGL